eukprot:m.117760 g.117760  ORF g.117760 m.117760 type:complete len:735 (-) comp10952_c0_seq1:245-2449(-)
MGADQSKKKSPRRSTSPNSSPTPRPTTGYLDEYTVYDHNRTYTERELASGSKVLDKRLKTLESKINSLSADSGQGFTALYNDITDGNDNPATASNDPAHKDLNRYTNVVAYDGSRVTVTPNQFNGNTDYINANFVNGHKHKNMYIAAQGPVPSAFYAFWQMAVERKSNIIVMVTNLMEGDNLKCHQYWPEPSQSQTFGDITVECVKEDVQPLMVVRKFRLTVSGTTRSVMQFQYTAWPDHGVPETTDELLKFRRTVRELIGASTGPIITHCSAGVGRTGTFIGLDRYLDSCADLDDSYSIVDIVKDMRKSRNFMVQTPTQFEYLFMACYDGLVVLLEKVNREYAMTTMSDKERQVQKQSEIETDIKEVTERFWERCHGMEMKKGRRVVPHARHTLPEDSKKDELTIVAKIKPSVRLESLAKSKDIWTERGNVPMSPEEHGYDIETAKLEDRLAALGTSRLNWTSCYENAVKTWQSAQDHEGVVYDIGHQLTSIENRVASLGNAEQAWKRRGGKRSVAEQIEADKLAALEARLESLAQEVVHADERWKARGDGMRQPVDQETASSAHTVDSMGGLHNILEALAASKREWEKNGKFNEEKFFAEITQIQERQAADEASRQAQAKEQQAAAAAAKAKADKEERERQQRINAEKQERERKEGVKAKMREKAVIQEEWSAEKAKQERDAKKQQEAKAKQEAMEKAKAEAIAKETEKRAVKENKTAAAKKASRFLQKQSK